MVRVGQPLLGALALAWIAVTAAAGGCSGSNHGSGFSGAGSSSGTLDLTDSGDNSSGGGGSSGLVLGGTGTTAAPCPNGATGWCSKVDTSCGTSSPTTLTGKVFDPAGKNPLYSVVVFIPNDESTLPAITQGTHTCNTCDVPIGNYVVATTTDYTGTFTLRGVPTGMGVPVTVQIGKWRRTIPVNITASCGTTTVSMSPTASPLLRLPGKKSDGDMPQMALLTGGCDDMACFLMNLGIDSAEFTAPGAGGRVSVYQGNSMPLGVGGAGPTLSNGTAGNCTTTSCPLWSTVQGFEAYDLALFSCECGEGMGINENATSYGNLHTWLNEGGKVFASHYHYTWFEDSPSADFKGVANWGNTADNDIAGNGGTYDIDTSFPKGATFGQWLGAVGATASAGPPPTIDMTIVADSVKTVNAPTSRWIYDPNGNDVKYLSFETPIGGALPPPDAGAESGKQYCGKAVFTDLHTGGSLFATAASVPADCKAADLTSQQKALEFLFFDLSACVTDDTQPVKIIPPPQ
ncbi:MAG: hypothetical protein ACLP1X_19430 [Polyangiaceae bacterium]|jgi:hypothetical protein